MQSYGAPFIKNKLSKLKIKKTFTHITKYYQSVFYGLFVFVLNHKLQNKVKS